MDLQNVQDKNQANANQQGEKPKSKQELTWQDKKASGNVPTQERLACESERCLM